MAKAVLLAVLTAHVALVYHSLGASAEDMSAFPELAPEKTLIVHLMEEYQIPLGRPMQVANESLPVTLNLGLYRVMEVYPEERKLVFFAGLRHKWMDSLLKWDPAEYSGIERVTLSSDDIWTPDFEHINAMEPPLSMLTRTSNAHVNYEGIVTWEPVFKFATTCDKFDQGALECNIIIGSYNNPRSQVSIEINEKYIQTGSYENNEEWEIHTSKLILETEGDYPRLDFQIKLRDRHWHIKQLKKVDSKASYLQSTSLPLLLLSILFFLI